MKKLLLVSYVFPPAAYVGVHRIMSLCKYLPRFGWEPVVLTIKGKDVLLRDENLCADIAPDIRVYRTVDLDPVKWGSNKFHNEAKGSGLERCKQYIRKCFLKMKITAVVKRILGIFSIPDSHIFWVPIAVTKGIKLIRKERFDLILSSSPPHSVHLISLILSKIFNLKYVADFRDPWGGDEYRKLFLLSRSAIVRSVEASMERAILRQADKIITVTNGEKRDLLRENPWIDENKVYCIHNGYDPEIFPNIDDIFGWESEKRKLKLTHVGTIYNGTADEFFYGLREFFDNHHEMQDFIEIRMIGQVNEYYQKLSAELGIGSHVNFVGFKSRRDAIKDMKESDVLLLLMGGNIFPVSEVPSKTYEYLYAGKPILAITGSGDLSEILSKSGLGILVEPKDAGRVSEIIYKCCLAKKKGEKMVHPDWDFIKGFERKELIYRLSQVINETTRR